MEHNPKAPEMPPPEPTGGGSRHPGRRAGIGATEILDRAITVVETDGADSGAAKSVQRVAVVGAGLMGHGIALALLPADVEAGERLALDQRGTEVPATVVDLPFVG